MNRIAERVAAGQHTFVIGIDEAGRGPLCGPVVAAACLIPEGVHIEGITDSKKLTDEAVRESLYMTLTTDTRIMWFASSCSPQEIDTLNILQASLKAMRDACNGLILKYKLASNTLFQYVALVDGNKVPVDMPVDCQYVIKGDSHIYSIAAASILAKVTRDRIMHQLDIQYPAYSLGRHKGYPTLEHRTLLYNLGLPTKKGVPSIYRFSYRPVQEAHQRQLLAAATKGGGEKTAAALPSRNGNSSSSSSSSRRHEREVPVVMVPKSSKVTVSKVSKSSQATANKVSKSSTVTVSKVSKSSKATTSKVAKTSRVAVTNKAAAAATTTTMTTAVSKGTKASKIMVGSRSSTRINKTSTSEQPQQKKPIIASSVKQSSSTKKKVKKAQTSKIIGKNSRSSR